MLLECYCLQENQDLLSGGHLKLFVSHGPRIKDGSPLYQWVLFTGIVLIRHTRKDLQQYLMLSVNDGGFLVSSPIYLFAPDHVSNVHLQYKSSCYTGK